MSVTRLALPFIFATIVAVGCGADPRAASKDNFGRAIDAKLQSANDGKLCLGNDFSAISLPYRMFVGTTPTTISFLEVKPDTNPHDPKIRAQLEALTTVGLAAKRPITVAAQQPSRFVFANGRYVMAPPQTLKLRAEEYDRGQQFAKYAHPSGSDETASINEICFAALQVDHVDEYSQPGQMMGATMSEVRYHAKAMGIADWANSPVMRSAFPTIGEQLEQAGSMQRSEMVVLMNDGWKAQ